MSETSDCVNFGILGCANIAQKNIKAIQETNGRCKLVAIASRDIHKARQYATANGLDASVALYGDYQALLDDETVHAVYVPLPTTAHLEWVTKAARCHKHVLLEKPVATNAAEFQAMSRDCVDRGLVLMDGTMYMHHARTEALLMQIQDLLGRGSRIGRVRSSFSFHGDEEFLLSNIRCSATADLFGALGDLGWYCVRFGILVYSVQPTDHGRLWQMPLRWPVSASAQCSRWTADEVPLECEGRIFFGGGEVFHFDCSFLLPLRQTFEICMVSVAGFGEDKILECDDFVVPRDDAQAPFSVTTSGTTGFQFCKDESAKVSKSTTTQQALMFENFSRLVTNGNSDSAYISERDFWAEVTLITQACMDACLQSMRTGGTNVGITKQI